ncbi:hypothetical protein FRC08_001275 [Ceratobasidium sp. 394]|nr:hypothetical protein FRC08_001275 [Ceratobasidium sp. 394]
MNSPGPIVHREPQDTSRQTTNDDTHTKSKQSDLDLNQGNVGGVQQQEGKEGLGQKLASFHKASLSTPASHGGNSQTADSYYYPPAEFRSLVLEELRGNCLEWDITRVRIVSASLYPPSSGECCIRFGLQGELGRFTGSHVLTLHPPAPKLPTNKRRLFPRFPGNKRGQKVEGLGCPTHEKSDQLKLGIPQPDGGSNELLPNPPDAATPDYSSPTSEGRTSAESLVWIPPQAQTADTTEQTHFLKSKPSITKSTPSIHRLLSPDESNHPSRHGDDPTGAPNHGTAAVESLTTCSGMNILPNDGSANTVSHIGCSTPPPMHSPNELSRAYTPAALTQSNCDLTTAARATDKEFPDMGVVVNFPPSPSSAKPPDTASIKANRRISCLHADGSVLAARSAPTAQAPPKRHRVSSILPSSTDSSSNPVGDYSPVTAPFKSQVPPKWQVTGIATGAFRVCARTVLDFKANVGAKPRTGCFHIADTSQADKYSSPVQDNTTGEELLMGDKLITLEDVVVLASTIAFRASRHIRAVHSTENWFLDAMWNGLHLVTGSANPEGIDGAIAELLGDVMSRFRDEITKFRREVSQIREAEDPDGKKRQELQEEIQQRIDECNKEIDAKIKATDALAKENRELELEKRRLQEMMQLEGKS